MVVTISYFDGRTAPSEVRPREWQRLQLASGPCSAHAIALGDAASAGLAFAIDDPTDFSGNCPGSTPSFSANRFVSEANSIARVNESSSSARMSCTPMPWIGNSNGTSSLSRTRSREIRACSANSISFSRRFGLLDLLGRREQRIEIAVFSDQLRRRLHADARHTRHVIDAIARERLNIDDLVGRDTELLEHFVRPDLLVLHAST